MKKALVILLIIVFPSLGFAADCANSDYICAEIEVLLDTVNAGVEATVTEGSLDDSTVIGADIKDDTIDSADYAPASVDAEHLAADIIDESKIADDGVDSEHYNDGSVDAAHLAADIVDETKIADNGIDSEHYNAGSVDNVHVATGIDAVKLADGSVTNAELQYVGDVTSAIQAQFNKLKWQKCIVLMVPTTAEDLLIWRNNTGATITIAAMDGILASGTNVVGQFYICQAADITDPMDIPTNCNAVDDTDDITFDGGLDSDDGTLGGDPTLADAEWLAWGTTTVSSPGNLSVCASE